MPLLITCPHPDCRTQFDLLEPPTAGTQLVCPHCSQEFAYTSPAAAIPGSDTVTAAAPPAAPPANPEATQDHVSTLSAPLSSIGQLGRFTVVRELGEGAFGKVYLGHDVELDRAVALKVAKLDSGDSSERVKRFLREARAAAGLRHPHIVPLYEFGQDGERFFIASAYIAGHTLKDSFENSPARLAGPTDPVGPPRLGGPEPAPGSLPGPARLAGPTIDLRRAARIVRALAEALAYAHGQGIVHRDVKPANVILDEKDQPLLLDFGLASRQDEAEQLTHAGAVLGTPLYMSPEQAGGRTTEVGPASDQYSLGVVLFELLTGKPPFEGTVEPVLLHHQRTEPPSPRRLNRAVPRDLETICLKCLEKDAAKRYASCQELADDLRRWLDGEPVRARRIGALARLGRWARRQPALASATGAALVLLIVAVVFGLQQWSLNTALTAAVEQRERQVRMALYSKEFDRALVLWQAHDVAGAREILANLPPDLQGWEWDFLQRLCQRKCQELVGHTGPVTSVVYSKDDQRLLSAGADGTARVWDLATDQDVLVLRGHKGKVFGAAFALSEKVIMTAGEDGLVKVWDASSGKEIRTLQGHDGAVMSLAVDGTGQRAATGGHDGTVRLWQPNADGAGTILRGHKGQVNAVALSADGSRVVSAGADGTARVWDTAKGSEVFCFREHQGAVGGVAFSPDGKRVASFSDQDIYVWEADGGRVVLHHVEPGRHFRGVIFSPDGRRLRIADNHGGVREMDSTSGKLQGQELQVRGFTSLALSHNGRELAVGTDFGVQHWRLDVELAAQIWPDRGTPGSRQRIAVSHDGRLIATALGRTVKLWEGATGRLVRTFTSASQDPYGNLRNTEVTALAFTPDGRFLYIGHSDSYKVWKWDLNESRESIAFGTNHGRVLAISSGGERVATYSRSVPYTVELWDTASGTLLRQLQVQTECAEFSSEGRQLATGDEAGLVCTWDVEGGQQLLRLEGHPGPVCALAFSADGQRLAATSYRRGQVYDKDGPTKIWNATTGKEIMSIDGLRFSALAFSPNGERLFTCAQVRDPRGPDMSRTPGLTERLLGNRSSHSVLVWDVRTGQELLGLRHGGFGSCLTLSPEGKVLYAGGSVAEAWDADTGAEVRTLRGHTQSVVHLAFSRDGRRLVSSSSNKVGSEHPGLSEILAWDSNTGSTLWNLKGGAGFSLLGFYGGDKFIIGIIYRGNKRSLALWEAVNGRLWSTYLTDDVGSVAHAAVSADGRLFSWANKKDGMRLYDLASGRLLRTFDSASKHDFPSPVAFSRDGKRLLARFADSGGTMCAWDVASGKRLYSLPPFSYHAAFSPEGDRVVVSGSPKVCDLATGRDLFELEGVPGVAVYSPDGRFIVGASWKVLFVWDAATGKKLRTLRGHFDTVHAIAFSPDGRYFATGGADRLIKIWDMERIIALLPKR